MKDAEKCLLVARELRERAKSHGPLARRARMLILAERLEAVAGATEHPGGPGDPVQLALGVYAQLMAEAKSDATNRA